MYVVGKHVYKGSSKTHVSAVQRAAQIETTRGGRRRVAVSLAALYTPRAPWCKRSTKEIRTKTKKRPPN